MKLSKLFKFRKKQTDLEKFVDTQLKKSGLFKHIFRITRLVFFLFFIFLAILIITISQQDMEFFRDKFIKTAESTLGANVEINGKMSWKLSLKPKIVLNDVVLKQTKNTNETFILKSDRITVTIKLLSLIKRNPIISEIKFENSDIYYKNIQAKTTKNKQTFDKNYEISQFPFQLNFHIRAIEFINTKINYVTKTDNLTFNPDILYFSIIKNKHFIQSRGYINYKENMYPFSIKLMEYDGKNYPLFVQIYNKNLQLKSELNLDAIKLTPNDYKFSLDLKNLDKQMAYFGIDDIIPLIPMNITSNGVINDKYIDIKSLKIDAGNNDLNATAFIDMKKKKPEISLKIKSTRISLDEVFPSLYGVNYPPTPDPTDRPLNAFKDTPMYSEYIFDLVNLGIQIDVKKLIMYRRMEATNISLKASLYDGVFNLATSNDFYKGHIETAVWARYISKEAGFTSISTSRGRDIYPGLILNSMNYYKTLVGLPSDFEFYFTANGGNLEQFMSSIDGAIHVYSTAPGTAFDATKYIFGSDFLTNIQSKITGIIKDNSDEKNQEIECAVVNLKVRDGISKTKKGIAVQTNMVNMLGIGEIDFVKETLNASLVSTPNKGLKISLSGNVLDVLEISGNLSDPTIKLNQSGVINKTLTAGITGAALAPLTGGLSFLALAGLGFATETVLSSWLSDENPCLTATKEGAPIEPTDPQFMKTNLDQNAKSVWVRVNNDINENIKNYFHF